MQTFLPYPEFEASAKVLDNKRLGKQRSETKILIDTLLGRPTKSGKARKGWMSHPAVLMWAGCEEALKLYYNVVIQEWINRGFNNNMEYEIVDFGNLVMPFWIGDPRVHAAYRSNLLRKDSAYYSQFGWIEPDNLPYVWPVLRFKGEE